MKVVTASTPEQQSYVRSLLDYFYSSVLPRFFSDTYVKDLKTFGVLCKSDLEEYSLQDIMEVTAALQTLQHLLECIIEKDHSNQMAQKFQRNQAILERHQIYFPFRLQDFTTHDTDSDLSMVKPANNWLI